MNKEKLNGLKQKVDFVNELSNVIVKVQTNIVSIEYRVFQNPKYEDSATEFVVINYKGGARSCLCSNMNSCLAIFELISKYLYNRNYENESWFVDCETKYTKLF